jgi:hypothetical protein
VSKLSTGTTLALSPGPVLQMISGPGAIPVSYASGASLPILDGEGEGAEWSKL